MVVVVEPLVVVFDSVLDGIVTGVTVGNMIFPSKFNGPDTIVESPKSIMASVILSSLISAKSH